MAKHNLPIDVRQFSVDERLALIEEIWDSLDEEGVEVSFALTKEQEEELDRRLAESIANPQDLVPWETVKSRMSQVRSKKSRK